MKKFYLFFSATLITIMSFAQTQMNLPVTFDDVTVNYGLVGFGGAEQSTIVTDPTLATNKVAKVIKTNTAELWAGTTVTALAGTVQTGFSANIPFTATEKRMNVRVWSPHAGIQVRLKVEDKNDNTKSCETEAAVTVASGWQTLEFNFANQAAGTAALNLAFSYNKASIFFNFGVTGATAGERIYYFDDMKFGAAGGGGGGGLTQMNLPVTFDDVTVNYGLVGFGGAEQSTIVTDPTLATNKVAKVIKTNTAELWAGTTVTALAGTVQTGFSANIPFTATEKRMNVRVWSPHAGIQVRLKVEDKNDNTKSCETEAAVTVASGWQTLEFNFANQAAGTAALNLAFSYNKASIFFNFGVTGATAGERIYYFDDMKFGAAGGGGGGGLTQMNLPVTFDDVTVNYGLVGFGGAEQSTIVTDPTLATNKVAKVIKTNTAELWAGTTVTALAGTVQTGFSANIPFTATEKRMNVRVWSPHAGIQVRLKVEDKNDNTKSCETEAAVTVASGWQTLEFNFANQAAGTAALNLAFSYNKASIFFNFGVTGATAGERIYYFDDMKFGAAGGGGGGGLTQMTLPVTFDDVTVEYGLVGFGGAEQSTIVTDPTLATNKVAKVIKTNTAELWAGTTVTALAGTVQTGFSANIPFTATEKRMNVRVWSPHAGIQVRLKVEDKNDNTKSCETEAAVTVASGWQTLEFNFANQAAGTAALNLAFSYNKASIFFNFGVTGATAGERIYYFDDMKFGAAGGGGGGGLTQMTLPVTFDDVTVEYGLVGFGGAEQSTIVTDPTLATNKVAKVIKTNTAELWAGTTVTALAGTVQTGFSANIPFTATEKRMNVRVWSPHAGIQVRLKVEDKNDNTKSCETEAAVTVASGWQTLEFNFANQAAGTAALNLAFSYNKASIFFNFGVTGATAGERIYYFDDMKFGAAGGGGGGGLTQMTLPVTFDDVTVEYGLVGFGGAEQSTIVTDPTLATNKVAKVIKTNTAELWAGTTVTALAGTVQTGFSANIPFTATEKRMNVRVWSPHAGIQVRLKVEDKNDNTKSCETEAAVTVASGWQTLEFNFANQAAGTAALNLAFSYNKASIFFNFGVTGATAGERIYYFDDMKFGAAGGGGGGGLTQMNLPVTFDDVTVNYGLVGFGGAEQSTIVTDPTLATNKVAKVIKTNTAELWAGTTVTALAGTVQTGFSANIPFTATEKRMNVRVWSPHAGIQVRLKVEDKNDNTKSCETEAAVTVASGWQTLEFNFANQAAGTAALNLAFSYNKASIFFNFGVTGATAGERIYYFDDMKFGAAGGGGGGGLTQMNLPVTFDDVTVNYGLVGFGGAEQSTIVTDPTLATNKVAKVIKTNTAELWAGTTVTALAGTVQTGFSANIPFTATEKRMNVRVWSPHAGIQVRLKVEDKNDNTKSCETEAAVTVASGWQTLEFNFANQAAGTAALNLAFSYNKASIFFNFGVTGATAGERIYYFDDMKFGAAGGGGGGGLTQMNLPVTFDDVTVNYGLVGFGGAEQSTIVTDPTLATNKVAKVIKTNTAELWAGTTVTALAGTVQTGFSANIPFTATEKRMNVRVWSPHAGIQVRLKVEDKNDNTKSCETEAAVTVASGWQTLEFNFANQAAGTAALNLAFSYNKASIFFNFGVTGATAGERIYYFDDMKFGAAGGGGGGGLTQMTLPVTFDDVTVEYGLVGFGGAEQSTIVTDPTLATNKVAKVIKTNTAELWAGTTVTALAGTVQTGFSANIPFTATEKRMNVRVWSPHAGIQVRLKVEDKNDNTKSCETEAAVTVASGWQTLEFNFANQAAGTAALNLAFSYNKASIFFNFGVTGATAGERIYYFDDMKFGAAPLPPAPPAPTVISPVNYCQNATAINLTATAISGNTLRWYTVPNGGTGNATAPIPSTATVGTTNYYVSQINAQLVEGPRALIAVIVKASPVAPSVLSPVFYCHNATSQILAATSATGNTLNWYTAAVGGNASINAPVPATNIVGNKSYYVSQTNDVGCESQRSVITVTINALPAVPVITAAPSNLYPGKTTTITSTGTTGNLAWYKNGILLPGQTGNTLNVNIDGLGTYTLKATNAAGCENISSPVTITGESNSELFIYPNPSTGQFQVRFFSDVNNLKSRMLVIYDALGSMVFRGSYVIFGAYTSIPVNLGNKGPGTYIVHLMDNEGNKLSSERVVIVR